MPSEHEKQLIAKIQGPEWEALKTRAKERMEWEFGRLANELMAGKTPPPEIIEYRRGFFAGMKFLLDQPGIEEKALLRALDRKDDEPDA